MLAWRVAGPAPRAWGIAAGLLALAAAGCAAPPAGDEGAAYTSLPGYRRDTTGTDAAAWPDLQGTLTVLDNGAFAAFDDAARQFQSLTGVEVVPESGGDTGRALQMLLQSSPGTYDVVYGLDNNHLHRAVQRLRAYEPALADRVPAAMRFPEAGDGGWSATPVDHGYIGINWDPRHTALQGGIDSLDDLRGHAGLLVVSHPRSSSPGLGFLLVTIDAYGEAWTQYWTDLFRGDGNECVLVAADWTEAYEQHYSAGYGAQSGGLADKPIVVSYTESPAAEVFFGTPPASVGRALAADGTTYHQVQTMAIAQGTRNLQAAQAWVEFTLTDFFQGLAAPANAVYPVVPGIDHNATYGELDPEPGTFRPVRMPAERLAADLDGWLQAWEALHQDPAVNCRLG